MFRDFYFQFHGTFSSVPELYHRLIQCIQVFVIFILAYLFHTKYQCKGVSKLGSMANRFLISRALATPREKGYNAF